MSPEAETRHGIRRSDAAAGSDKVSERAWHILWEIRQGHVPKVAVVGSPTTSKSIRAALNAAGLGSLDVTARGVVALPLFAFSDAQIERVWEKLLLV